VIAECQNKLIGRTSLDVDIDRARRPLGMSAKDADEILPYLDAGQFYAAGFGVKGKARMVQVGAVQTTHPRAGAGVLPVTPPRGKVAAILAKLADVPQEAKAEVETVDALRARVRELEGRAEVPLVDNATLRSALTAERARTNMLEDVLENITNGLDAIVTEKEAIRDRLATLSDSLIDLRNLIPNQLQDFAEKNDEPPLKCCPRFSWGDGAHDLDCPEAMRPVVVPVRENPSAKATFHPVGDLGKLERAFLTVLAQRGPLPKPKVLLFAGYAAGGKPSKAFARIVREGYATSDDGTLAITVAGEHALGPVPRLPRGRELREAIREKLPSALHVKIFNVLVDVYPQALQRSEVLRRAGYAAGGKPSAAFGYLVARDYAMSVGPGKIVLCKELFDS
jgi:hypothetical protein